MIKRILPFVFFSTLLLSNYGCKNDTSFKKINGVEYRIVKDMAGKKPAVGDYMDLSIILKVSNKTKGDSIILSSDKVNNGKPVSIPLQPGKKNDWSSALAVLSAGDSAVIRVSVDSLMKQYKGQLPPFMHAGDYLVYEVKVFAVKTAADFQKDMQDKAKLQAQTDDKMIQDYLAKNNIKAEKTPMGVYYSIQKEGNGDKISKGQTAYIKYLGKTLDGKTFDGNIDSTFGHTDPLSVKVGFGSVIPGMDEGMTMLKKNTKATLYIPSPLAYGEKAPPSIGPNAILVFELEVTDVKTDTK